MTQGLLPHRIMLFGLIFYTVWTVGVHITTLLSLGFDTLYLFLVAAVALAIAGQFRAGWLHSIFGGANFLLPRVRFTFRLRLIHLLVIGAALAVLILAMAFQYFRTQFVPFWALCIVCAFFAVWLAQGRLSDTVLSFDPPKEREGAGLSLTVGTVLVCGALLLLYFFTSIPDTDDSLFLNMAVGAKQNRDAIYVFDTMLGVPGLEFMKSTYKIESYTLLAAILSDLTGLSVILSAHTILPALGCIWAGGVLVVLHHALFGRAWLTGVILHLVWLIGLDGALSSFGYHAIPRFIHGKGPFVTLMVPLIAYLTAVSICRRDLRALGLVCMALIASIGFTANAIYAAPLAAALVAGPFLLIGNGQQRIASLRVAAAVVYPAIIAAILVIFDPPKPSESESAGTAGDMVWGVFGSNYALLSVLGLAFLASVAGVFHTRMRIVSLYMLGLFIVVLNPFLWDFYGENVTGNINYRLIWAVPVPFIVAIVTTLIWFCNLRLMRVLVAVLALGFIVGPGSILHEANIGLAFKKVPPEAYGVAVQTNDLTEPGARILAPEEVSAWIPTLEEGRPVVEGRQIYLPQRQGQLPEAELSQRALLFDWIAATETPEASNSDVLAALEQLSIETIAVREGLPAHQLLADGQFPFAMTDQIGDFAVFAKSN
ncbi:hypothetical protein [Aliiroseovarius sp. YM-037]|uniref:hypothetical protein n=1 Tax=Aliiroseovarius sp. YM-037 TaxID=3341728 RepID=UPI003A800919